MISGLIDRVCLIDRVGLIDRRRAGWLDRRPRIRFARPGQTGQEAEHHTAGQGGEQPEQPDDRSGKPRGLGTYRRV